MPMIVSKKGKQIRLSKFNFSKDYTKAEKKLKLDDDYVVQLNLDPVDGEVWKEWNLMFLRAEDAKLKKLADVLYELIQSHEPA